MLSHMILDAIPNYFQTLTTDINLETTMTLQTLKKNNWVSQSDQSMQLFVPSHREINKNFVTGEKDYQRYPNWSNALQHVRTM